MAQIRNRYDIKNLAEDERNIAHKTLPRFFNERDYLDRFLGINISIVIHAIFVVLLIILNFLMGIIIPHLPKPELPNRDIEFKLVQNESKPPINKKTNIRSDRDSQAGGKHDPKKKISEPSPAPKKEVKQAVKESQPKAPKQEPKQKVQAVQPKKQIQPAKQPVKQQPVKQQPVKQQPAVQKPTPAKPSAVKAPSTVKPTLKPTGSVKPAAPKPVSAPKSPFSIPVPSNSGNTGTSYKPAGTPSSGGSTASSGAKGSGSVAPAPKFSSSGGSGSSSGGSSAGSGGSKYASRGTGGYGTGGNPSPGNPNGTPGIDAIREPNWGPYMRDLEQRIKRNWSPPKGDSSKRVVITFTIGRDGRLLSHRVTKSSGVPLADRAAMSAIELTAPFRPLPPEFKGQSVPIEFTFDYNVLNSVLRR